MPSVCRTPGDSEFSASPDSTHPMWCALPHPAPVSFSLILSLSEKGDTLCAFIDPSAETVPCFNLRAGGGIGVLGMNQNLFFGAFSPHSFTATSKAKKRHLFFQSYKIFCFSIPAQKAKALRTLSKGFGIEMPKSKKKGPTASFGSESLAELCELLCCYAGLHIFGRSNGD